MRKPFRKSVRSIHKVLGLVLNWAIKNKHWKFANRLIDLRAKIAYY